MKTCIGLFLSVWLFSIGTPRALAVILFGSGDPEVNTTEPTGDLTNSGWQWVGKWGNTSGVAIAPNYFITVRHVGGSILDPFVFHGREYLAAKFFDDPATELRIVLVVGSLPLHAPFYSQTDELGKRVVVVGRGTQRGNELLISAGASLIRKGWVWGRQDGVQRWGENRVNGVLKNPNGGVEMLMMRFDASGGPNEAHLSPGDSGGGLFIQEGFLWRLAGLNNTAEGQYSLGPNGPGVAAAVFDEGGLYKGGNPSWELIPDTPFDQPSRFFCIRVSPRLDWIRGVIGATSTAPPPELQTSSMPSGPFVDAPNIFVDVPSRSLAIPSNQTLEFYRLKSSSVLRITAVQVRDGTVWLTYE